MQLNSFFVPSTEPARNHLPKCRKEVQQVDRGPSLASARLPKVAFPVSPALAAWTSWHAALFGDAFEEL